MIASKFEIIKKINKKEKSKTEISQAFGIMLKTM
jgi:hypothetical protein